MFYVGSVQVYEDFWFVFDTSRIYIPCNGEYFGVTSICEIE